MRETPQVEAFILAKQDEVLQRAITALRQAPADHVAAEVHRILGTLGTYCVSEAAEALQPLNEKLKMSGGDLAVAEAAREDALTALTEVERRRAKERA